MSACVATSTESVAPQGHSRLQAFLLDPFDDLEGVTLGTTQAMEKVNAQFGQPNKKKSDKRADRTSDGYFNEVMLEYDDMTIVIGEASDKRSSWIKKIEIDAGERALKYGISIGSERGDVLRALQPDFLLENNENEIRMAADIRQLLTDDELGKSFTVEVHIDLLMKFDAADRVKKIVFTSIED